MVVLVLESGDCKFIGANLLGEFTVKGNQQLFKELQSSWKGALMRKKMMQLVASSSFTLNRIRSTPRFSPSRFPVGLNIPKEGRQKRDRE